MLLESRIPLRYVFSKVRFDVLGVLAVAVFAAEAVHETPLYVPEIPVAIPAFLGTAISLILSFKLNQSYDRWWEARKVWGAIVNDSRTLLRQLLAFAGDQREFVRRVGHRQIAWCYALGQSLRGQNWRRHTAGHLRDEDVAEANAHANKPVALLQQHAHDLARAAEAGHLTDYQRVAVDETLTRLTDSMGMAERIRNTVFPSTYRIFLHVFIYLFITVLSISLAEIGGTWGILVSTSIAIPFFLLEKTATHMQDPFANRPTDTAVTAIARTIEIDVLQLLGEEDVPAPLEAEGFYLM